MGSWLLARLVPPYVHTVRLSALKNFPENGDKQVDKREMFKFGNNLESEAEKCCILCSYTRQTLREIHSALWCLRVAPQALTIFVSISGLKNLMKRAIFLYFDHVAGTLCSNTHPVWPENMLWYFHLSVTD